MIIYYFKEVWANRMPDVGRTWCSNMLHVSRISRLVVKLIVSPTEASITVFETIGPEEITEREVSQL